MDWNTHVGLGEEREYLGCLLVILEVTEDIDCAVNVESMSDGRLVPPRSAHRSRSARMRTLVGHRALPPCSVSLGPLTDPALRSEGHTVRNPRPPVLSPPESHVVIFSVKFPFIGIGI